MADTRSVQRRAQGNKKEATQNFATASFSNIDLFEYKVTEGEGYFYLLRIGEVGHVKYVIH